MPRKLNPDENDYLVKAALRLDSEALFSWIDANLSPEEVFENETLAAWADNNGYKKDE